jgi:hypothetical protein
MFTTAGDGALILVGISRTGQGDPHPDELLELLETARTKVDTTDGTVDS